jgi:phosphoribosylaminoimidazole-succinocarboxamide synthase
MKTTRGKWTFTVDLQKYTVSQIDTILKYVYYDVSHAIEHREITLEDKKYELGLVIDDLNEDMNKFAEEWP